MCVVTGQHMVKEDWCLCPRSRMPALLSQYESYLEHEQVICGTHARTRVSCWLCLSLWFVVFSRLNFQFSMYPSKRIP